jgi:hypothetical protein
MEYDDDVDAFEEQPVRIPLDKGQYYVPDLLVYFRKKPGTLPIKKPHLIEIKHTSDLDRNKEKYKPKFLAADIYASSKGWEFQKYTQIQIRTPRLETLKFLREYFHSAPSSQDISRVISILKSAKTLPLDELLNQLCTTDMERLFVIPTIWHMVALRQLEIDFDMPISEMTMLSLPKKAS